MEMNMFDASRISKCYQGQCWYSNEGIFAVTYIDENKEFFAIVDGTKQKFSNMDEFEQRYPLMKMYRDFSSKRKIRARRKKLGLIK